VTGPDDGAEARSACADCPVGFLRDVMHEAHPEATLHLVAAARELVLAFETVLRATEQTLQRDADGAPARRERPVRVRHIDIA
jgi:hypothetical protein